MIKIKAFQVADYIDLKRFRNEYTGELLNYSSSELFYREENDSYMYILSYGVVVFAGYDDLKISENLAFIRGFSKKWLNERIAEEIIIHPDCETDKFGHNEIYLSRYSPDILKIVMLNVGMSVALDYYQLQTSALLEETYKYTETLEKRGRLSISGKTLLKFVGKTLNVKNSIIDELYVIDQPEATWNDEYINKIDLGLRGVFEIKQRFKNIDYSLQIIKENLDLFKDLIQHNQSKMLEIIIIVLIFVEVVNMFIEKLL